MTVSILDVIIILPIVIAAAIYAAAIVIEAGELNRQRRSGLPPATARAIRRDRKRGRLHIHLSPWTNLPPRQPNRWRR